MLSVNPPKIERKQKTKPPKNVYTFSDIRDAFYDRNLFHTCNMVTRDYFHNTRVTFSPSIFFPLVQLYMVCPITCDEVIYILCVSINGLSFERTFLKNYFFFTFQIYILELFL